MSSPVRYTKPGPGKWRISYRMYDPFTHKTETFEREATPEECIVLERNALKQKEAVNVFEEYGCSLSFQEALEKFVTTCMLLMIPCPKKIVFPKGALSRIADEFYPKQRSVEGEPSIVTPGSIVEMTTHDGIVRFEEEE